MNELYDSGESYCPGDPDLASLSEQELVALERLQSSIDAVNAIEDDDERLAAAAELWHTVEGYAA